MHYYPHHIGDYQRDTAHLSVTEHGVYRLLLDHYYATERPLPTDFNTLCRIIRATSKSERDAVSVVTMEFFRPTAEGFTHKRVLAEIAEYARLKERNKANGQKGGRPKTQGKQETQKKPSGLSAGSSSVGENGTQTEANQYPIANSHSTPSNEGVHTRAKSKGTREDVVAYCQGEGLTPDDGEWFFDKAEGCGWKNNGKAIVDWRATVRAWKRSKYFPSQKGGMNGFHRPKHAAYNPKTATEGLTQEQILEF